MTEATLTHQTRVDDHRYVAHWAAAGIAGAAASAIVLLIRNVDDGPVWRVGSIHAATIVVISLLVYRVGMRRAIAKADGRASARTAIVLSLLGVLSILVFWMAVPPLFGVAAVALALDARDRRPFRGQRLADVAGVLGALVTVVGLVLAFVG